MARCSVDERGPIERVELHLVGRGHGGRAWNVAEKCDLAEVVARPALAQRLAVAGHLSMSTRDDVEAVARLPFSDDRATGRIAGADEAPCGLVLRGQRQRPEHRNA